MTTASPTLQGGARSAVVDSLGAWATILFLGVVAGTQMVDRGLLAMLSPDIQKTYQVDDAAMGALLGIAGILVASLLAVPLARLADKQSRKLILLAFVAAWSVLTIVAALAPTFWIFFIGRAAAGITEFALIPVIYSLIPDLVSERHRVLGNLTFAAIMAAGASAGWYFASTIVAFAGELAVAYPALLGGLDTWRTAMLVLAVLGLPLIVIGLAAIDPPRARGVEDAAGRGSLIGFARRHAALLVTLIIAAGGTAIAVQGLTQMIVLALTRSFPRADLAGIGQIMGLLILITNFASLALAGAIDRVLRPRLPRLGRPLVMAAGAAMAAPCVALMLAADSSNTVLILTGAFLLATCIASAFIPTIIQDIVPNQIRARAFAVYSLIISVFCAIGPVMVGALSDYVLARDLLSAIVVAGAPSLIAAAVCAVLATRHYPRAA